MSELSASHYSPKLGEKSLVRVGGAMGIAAASISLAIFTIGCFGFNAIFQFLPLIPLALSIPGLLITVIGATIKKSSLDEDTHAFAAMFVCSLGLIGAILEIAVWQDWNLFFNAGGSGK